MEVPDFVQEQVTLFLNDKQFSKITKIQFSNASNEGDNYLGSLYRVKIETENNDKNEELNLIIKCFPLDEKMRIFSRIDNMFLNEIAFYEERLPLFVNLLREFNLQLKDVPFYYKGCKTPKREVFCFIYYIC